MYRLSLLVLLVVCAGCTSESPTGEESVHTHDVALARPAVESVAARVENAQARLAETEAGRRVWSAIEAHGGLARWYRNGPIRFRYRYERGGDEPALDTKQLVDTWSSRARHTLLPDSAARFGWTGAEAWFMPDSAELPINARFWSLTPYYFIAMPFVLADPGVNLESAGDMMAEDQRYDLVRVTFESGTGDAPDDYYLLLLDPETDRVGGVRYVVLYPGFFPEGRHTPERMMLYDGEQTVDGILLQRGFRSFAWSDDGVGEPAARGTLSDVHFVPTAPDSLFAKPAGAAVQAEL